MVQMSFERRPLVPALIGANLRVADGSVVNGKDATPRSRATSERHHPS